jgi:hypothetical protein
MSTAFQLSPYYIPLRPPGEAWGDAGQQRSIATAAKLIRQCASHVRVEAPEDAAPEINHAFYRKHTERLLRRYLYASMQVGRSPNILGESVGRGWVSSRKVTTFEDSLIFVLDIERCLAKLRRLDRNLISRMVLQEYTQSETASFLGICTRTVSYKFPLAIDRLTVLLLKAQILVLPA